MGSIVLDAEGECIYRSANLPNIKNVSMAGWVKIASTGNRTFDVVAGARHSTYGEFGLCFFGSSIFVQYVGEFTLGNNWDDYGSPAANPPTGEWIYFAMTSGASERKGYCWNADGTLIAASPNDEDGSVITTGATAQGMTIGGRPVYLDYTLRGKYAYWKVWDDVLTQSEFEADMFSSTVVRTTNFNTGFADSATDIGPNGRNWTLSGSTSTDSDTPPVSGGGSSRFTGFGGRWIGG